MLLKKESLFRFERRGPAVVLDLRVRLESLDCEGMYRLSTELESIGAALGGEDVILDVFDQHINSSLLGAALRLLRVTRGRGTRVALVTIPSIREILVGLRLGESLFLVTSVAEAAAILRDPAARPGG